MTQTAERPHDWKASDPYPFYHRIRRQSPVCNVAMGFDTVVLVSGYDEVVALLQDPRFSAQRIKRSKTRKPEDLLKLHPLTRIHLGFMVWRDPPDHTRLRNLVSKAFTPRIVEQLRPHCISLAREMVEELANVDRPDLIRDLAGPYPVHIIAEMLGVPAEDRDDLARWSTDLAQIVEPTQRWQSFNGVREGAMHLRGYFEALVAERRRHPRSDDLLSRLISAEARGDVLHEEEVIGTLFFLLAAGHETTRNLIGNGMLALLEHPEQAERMRRNRGLVPSGVDELLRYDCPVQFSVRKPIEDTELRGVFVPKGREIYTLFGAANRDPEQFAEPDRLDVGRRPNRHLAFSSGIHHCLGASLGRMEGEIVLDTLLQKHRKLGLAVERSELEWAPGLVLRGLRSLPVVL